MDFHLATGDCFYLHFRRVIGNQKRGCNGKKGIVEPRGGVTACVKSTKDDDGSTTVVVGMAVCSPLDQYRKAKGRHEALAKTNDPKSYEFVVVSGLTPRAWDRTVVKEVKKAITAKWKMLKARRASRIPAWNGPIPVLP